MSAKLNHYVGRYADDAAANAAIAANGWTVEDGWLYGDTTLSVLKIWDGEQGQWVFAGTEPTTGVIKSYTFSSTLATGSWYVGGYYEAPAADASLDEGSASQTYGGQNHPYGAHAFIVAGGAGVVASGQVGIRVNGASMNDQGVRTAGDSETLIQDITTLSQDDYVETTKKWVGQVTFELFVVSGTPATYSLDCNYGFCKYDDLGNRDFTLTDFECVGRAGANDNGFDIELIHHKPTGWIYSAAAFIPGPSALIQMTTDYGVDSDLDNGEMFAWKRDNLSEAISGSTDEGFLIRVTIGAQNAVRQMDCHIGASVVTPT